ncbi:hypothetical protein [Candidatus Protofrankia californiensis]|uniref:hypothetical protein n=1 Tax=Candidatus Protofrankia californiensis TaxID=1839754 RepID=UPI0013EA89E1|nr:hypothetical protein [Candidatus Protofrankia californiensis]
MTTNDPFSEFLATVKGLRDDSAVRVCAHTSSVCADAWTEPSPTGETTPETSTR